MTNSDNTNPLKALSNAMADAVEKAGAATVTVDARRRFPASGICTSKDTVVTADHIVEREENIAVTLADGSQYSGTLAGRDPGSDLALLRLNEQVLMPADLSTGDARIGQIVLALGRPSSDGIQASFGIISAIGAAARTRRGVILEKYLRSDTIPYPGFSGGPLIDASGDVMGLNTSGLSRGGSLTIPIALVAQIAETLAEHGQVRRGYLGIRSQPVSIPAAQQESLGRVQKGGLLLVSVEDNSPASQGGLLLGDILVGLAGKPVSDPDDLLVRLSGSIVGQPTEVEVLRGGQPLSVTITIGVRK